MEKQQDVERSIIKKFRKEIWLKFVSGIQTYKLIQENDKIAVCMSGGKDSMLLAKCMQEIQRHGQMHFDLTFLVMDPGYSSQNRKLIERNAELLQVPIQIFDSDIFEIVTQVEGGSPCYLCARMRRGFLYNKAQELGCNKIALGHHFDDVIETILLSMFYGGELKTMMPKLHSTNFKGMELIRPLYMVKEESVIKWKQYNQLQFLDCACRFTENTTVHEDVSSSKRYEMKLLIQKLRQMSPLIETNIFRSMENVHLGAITGFRKNGEKHSFLEFYDQEDQ